MAVALFTASPCYTRSANFALYVTKALAQAAYPGICPRLKAWGLPARYLRIMVQSNNPISNRSVSSGLGRYFTLARKWLWLLVLITLSGGVAGYLYARTIVPTYRATITMLIGQLQQNTNPSENDLQASTNLSAAYALLTQQPRILEATAKAVNYKGAWQDLFYTITTAAQPQLLRISVTERDPLFGQGIANELANQLITQGPAAEQQAQTLQERQFVQVQLQNLQKQILTGQKTVDDLTTQTTIENDPETLKDLNARLFCDARQGGYVAAQLCLAV